jgi:hypothetical protein
MKIRTRPNSEELSHLTALVARDDPPLWLNEFFGDWSSSLFVDRDIFERQPTRSQVVDALKRMRAEIRRPNASAQSIDSAVWVELFSFLKYEERKIDLDANGLEVTLSDLDDWVSEALRSKELAGKNGMARKGPGRAMPPRALSSKDYCAVIVAEAWYFYRGVWPKPRDPKACEAAEMLWRIAGGEAHSLGEEPYASWRYHFARAQDAPGIAGLRSEIRRYLHELRRDFDELEPYTKLLAETGASLPHNLAQESV